jgi:hypothetical protein
MKMYIFSNRGDWYWNFSGTMNWKIGILDNWLTGNSLRIGVFFRKIQKMDFWVKRKTNGTIRKCSSRAIQWMVIIKMVPFMSGNWSKCHPSKNIVAWGTYGVLKNPHHAQQGNWVHRPFLIGSWDWWRWGTDDETNFPWWLCGWVCKMFVF